jgi:hypothetical protein
MAGTAARFWLRLKEGMRGHRPFLLATAVLAAAVLAAVLPALRPGLPPSARWSPPPFEANAVAGEPRPAENYAYSPVLAPDGYGFGMAGNLYRQENGGLNIYLANPADSGVWIMCEVADTAGDATLFRSGILREGEHVVGLPPAADFADEAVKVEVRVYGFEPETYQSRGTVYLYATLQPW